MLGLFRAQCFEASIATKPCHRMIRITLLEGNQDAYMLCVRNDSKFL